MCCFASRSPRSIRFASSTSCAAVSSWCLPASRRKSWRASVVVSTGWAAGAATTGSGSLPSGSSGTSSMPRRSSSVWTASTSSGSSSRGSSSSTSSCWRSWPLASAASSSAASSSLPRIDSISTVNWGPPDWSVTPGLDSRAFTQPKHVSYSEIKFRSRAREGAERGAPSAGPLSTPWAGLDDEARRSSERQSALARVRAAGAAAALDGPSYRALVPPEDESVCWAGRRCRRRSCAHCGPIRAGDEFRKFLDNIRAYGGRVVLVAVTAPGKDKLPWDPSLCAIAGPHKHGGEVGCRVVEAVAYRWNVDASARYARLFKAASIAADRLIRRLHGPSVRLPRRVAVVWSVQQRGVWHVHEGLPFESHVEKQWSRAVVT